METIQTSDAAADSTLPSRPVWTFLPLSGKGEGQFTFIDAADYEWASEHRWRLDRDGYVVRGRRVDGTYETIALARVILGLDRGDPREGDHVNRDKLDNRRVNLRIVTHAQNGQNRGGNGPTASRFRGVSWNAKYGKWSVIVIVKGKRHFLGNFDDEQEAADVASAFRREHMPYSEDARKDPS
jgi:hypothetical protein